MKITLQNPVYLEAYAAIGGKAEKEGPLGAYFDEIDETERFGQETWEQSESEMQRRALSAALKKANLADQDIGLLFAGDLMNQCTSSSYGLLSFDIPQVGLYGACSTAAESIALAAMSCDLTARPAAAVTSSHFCSAERQFRYPLEYGGQRTPTAQRTVTGSGAFILSRKKSPIRVDSVMFGRSIDSKISDICNMGAAMAPAAVDTLSRYMKESGRAPCDFHTIVTGEKKDADRCRLRRLRTACLPQRYSGYARGRFGLWMLCRCRGNKAFPRYGKRQDQGSFVYRNGGFDESHERSAGTVDRGDRPSCSFDTGGFINGYAFDLSCCVCDRRRAMCDRTDPDR